VALDRGELDYGYEEYIDFERRRLLISELAYVKDNSVGRYFGPMNGMRYRLSLSYSPNLYPNADISDMTQGWEFYTAKADLRKYIRAGYDHNFSFRVTGGASFGDNPQSFFLGGVNNWINRPYYINVDQSDIEDIYLSEFVMPLRGASFYERNGNQYFLTNAEFRFPFIHYLIFGWPIPYPFVNMRGAIFSDFGAAWSNKWENFNLFHTSYNESRLCDAIWGFGFGIRFPFPFIGWPTQWDVAWKSDLVAVSKPKFYLSLGYEF
jgi:outer membrane protein assembly factor BamA